MAKVAINGNQVTLPGNLREVLTAAEDDAIEVEEVDEGLLLKRSESGRRTAGIADIRAAQAGVRYRGNSPRPTAAEEEQQIADLLAADKAGGRAQNPQ